MEYYKTENNTVQELFEALLLLKNTEELNRFFKDLCTPQEIKAISERWKVCKLLNENRLSYREIHSTTGASLATISRVARFLKNEPNCGYKLILNRISNKEVI